MRVLLQVLILIVWVAWSFDGVQAVELYQSEAGAIAYHLPTEEASLAYQFSAGEEFKVMGRTEDGWLVVAFSDQTLAYLTQDNAVPALGENSLDTLPTNSARSFRGRPKGGRGGTLAHPDSGRDAA